MPGLVTIGEGALALANLVEGIARMEAAKNMLSRDIAIASAAGLTDIPDTAVLEARKYALSRKAALDTELASDPGDTRN